MFFLIRYVANRFERSILIRSYWLVVTFVLVLQQLTYGQIKPSARERISLNKGWRFMRYSGNADSLVYDLRPEVTDRNDNVVADTRATQSGVVRSSENVLKKWVLPTANDFIKDPAKRHQRPIGNPGGDFPFVQTNFNESGWETVDLPHDWAINGPFYKEANAIVGGGMGRLPVQGVAWYRKSLKIPQSDAGKSIFLDIDGAMSYAMVWINGQLAGGWPYGYNSFRIDLTPYLKYGVDNQLAIRLDNPTNSSRWYPGGGIYRNVWLTKVNPVHVAQWGTFIKTHDVSASAATVELAVTLDNKTNISQTVDVLTDVFLADENGQKTSRKIGTFPKSKSTIKSGDKSTISNTLSIKNPLLWEVLPARKQHIYVAVTQVFEKGVRVDQYETPFGIRSVVFDPIQGVLVNGKALRIQGVNQHHDLGALGAAFNSRAAERQLEMLRELGCNAIRLSHNPPAPELLDLTDRMGFLVMNEAFDYWEKGKTPLDFHLIFNDWGEADLRSFIRRDKNHPSIIQWSFGNEVGEQYTAEEGAALAKKLHDITVDEDPTRPATASMNFAKPDMPFSIEMDVLSLNYQGEGIRDAPAYAHLKGIRTSPLYPAFQKKFPNKLIQSTETASAFSTRGVYTFPVTREISAPVSDSTGGDAKNHYVSSYDLYTAAFGASPDKVFSAQDHNPYVAGEYVWTGWDYLGEPTPYYTARSSYSGIIDLAGFKKDRFYLYQARWRPNLKMAHILPHWNWPGREGKVTPVHVYTSGDEAELFLNNKSLGRKKRAPFEYRFRWDEVAYTPGELRVVTYKNGKAWATDVVRTTKKAAKLQLEVDRKMIKADGYDLAFVTIKVVDDKGNTVPDAGNLITFEVSGVGELVATDNGDPTDLVSFASAERKALSGLVLAIVKAKSKGVIKIKASAPELSSSEIEITTQ